MLAALALLGACRSTPAPTLSAGTPVAPAPFEPGPRYATTFEATYVGSGRTSSAYEGEAVLAIAPDRRATFELTRVPKDVHGLADAGIVVVHAGATPSEPPSPITCRWMGTAEPASGRWIASLEADAHARSAECDAAPPLLALDCGPVVMPVPDARGVEHEASLLRCTVASPVPSVLWVLGDIAFWLSEEALHLRLEAGSFGLSHQTLSLGTPSKPK